MTRSCARRLSEVREVFVAARRIIPARRAVCSFLSRLNGSGSIPSFRGGLALLLSSLQGLPSLSHPCFCRSCLFSLFLQGHRFFCLLARPFILSLAGPVNSFSSPLPVGKGGYRGNGGKSGQGVIFLVLRTSPLNALCRQRGAYGQAAFFFAAFMGGIAQNSNSPRLAPRGVTI